MNSVNACRPTLWSYVRSSTVVLANNGKRQLQAKTQLALAGCSGHCPSEFCFGSPESRCGCWSIDRRIDSLRVRLRGLE